jgi:hypothetical protein
LLGPRPEQSQVARDRPDGAMPAVASEPARNLTADPLSS